MRKGYRPERVEHWAEKKLVLLELWYLVTPNDIADYVFPEEENADLAIRVQGNLDHWEEHFPIRKDGPGPRFFAAVARKLGCERDITGNRIVLCKVDEFIGFIPKLEDQARAWARLRREAEQGTSAICDEVMSMINRALAPESPLPEPPDPPPLPAAAAPGLHAFFHDMKVRKRSYLQSIRQGARTGRLDQRHYYLTPDAADSWLALVRAEAYPSYDHCKSGLKKLVESKTWRETIAECRPDTVVMLAGGGAPTKDLVIIQSLLQTPALKGRPISYYLIDISPYMLCSSYWYLHDSLAEVEGGERVDVQPVLDDVLELKELTAEHFRRDGTILFGITGGTIGNLLEDTFFAALNRVSRKGDLLIVSADTIPEGEGRDLEVVEENLIHKYDHQHLRRFIGPAVRSLAAEVDLQQPVGSVFDKVSVELDEEQLYSSVPGSTSVTMHLEADEKRINLLSSTRYLRSAMTAFAREKKWIKLAEVNSPLNEDFVQFFFQRLE